MLFRSILPAFEEAVVRAIKGARQRRKSESMTLKCVFVSGTRAKAVELDELLRPAYWTEHLRQPVRFSEAILVATLGADSVKGCSVLLELGAQPILLGLAMANLEGKRSTDALLCCPSLRKSQGGQGDWDHVLAATARLYIAGTDLDWGSWYARCPSRPRKLSLPTYAFDRQR